MVIMNDMFTLCFFLCCFAFFLLHLDLYLIWHLFTTIAIYLNDIVLNYFKILLADIFQLILISKSVQFIVYVLDLKRCWIIPKRIIQFCRTRFGNIKYNSGMIPRTSLIYFFFYHCYPSSFVCLWCLIFAFNNV